MAADFRIRPLADRVVIKPAEREEKAKASIYLLDTGSKERPMEGTVYSDEDVVWTRHDGAVFPTAFSAAPIVTDGQVVGAVVVFRDMTEERQAALILAQQTAELARSRAELEQLLAEVQELALTDDLTALYNRRGFFTLAAQQMKVAKRTKHALSVIFIDLDDLKGINDRWGHQAGSEAISATAHILTASFRDSDIIARFGGMSLSCWPWILMRRMRTRRSSDYRRSVRGTICKPMPRISSPWVWGLRTRRQSGPASFRNCFLRPMRRCMHTNGPNARRVPWAPQLCRSTVPRQRTGHKRLIHDRSHQRARNAQ
jgi:co-chaperonin GroES (HSP10)